jgi:putative ABC transport system permease protein
MDIAGLQDRFARDGRLTRIDVRLRPGHDAAATRQRLSHALPPGVGIVAPHSNVESTARLTRAYRVNLDVLALVALFTGGLLVFSTQALSVLRRRVPFALLRSLGLARAHLLRLVIGEAALLGMMGAAAGLLAGWALASFAVHWFGLDLGAGFFRGRASAVTMDWPSALAFGALGIAAAVLGSAGPAWDAARVAPAQALKAGDIDIEWGLGRSPWPALAGLALGAALTLMPPVAGLPLFGYAAIALLLLSTLRLLPRLSAALLGIVPPLRPVPAALALAQLRHAPAQSTLSLAAIVASVSLMAAMAVMVTSFRGSLDAWLMQVLPADLYVRAGSDGNTGYLAPQVQREIAALPGVARVEFTRSTSIALRAGEPAVTVLARDIDATHPDTRLALVGQRAVPRPGGPPPAWISEATADRFGWHAGDIASLPLGGRLSRFTVAGVWRDYARQQGSIVVERATYERLTGDARVNEAALWLTAPGSPDAVRRALDELAGAGRLDFATPGELRATSLHIFDRTFAVTYALEAVAVLIGLAGLSSGFGARVLARRREFGMLRHLGVTRRQVGAMLAVEGMALAAVGVIVGLVLGLVIALILIEVVNRQSFHWSMDLIVPWAGLAVLAAALIALATVTAWLAGRQAMSADAVRAVREDW